MLITTRQKHQLQPLRLNLYLHSQAIEQVTEHKVLGLIIDNKLNWTSHIRFLCKRLSQNIFLLSRLRHYVDTNALRMFFFAHCVSHINYASTIWCNAAEAHIKQLNSLHRRAVKLLFFPPREYIMETFEQLNILPLHLQFHYNVGVYMYKICTGGMPSYLSHFFQKATDRYDSSKYIVPLPRIDLYKSSLSFWGSMVWNSLPEACRSANSIYVFKKLIRHHLTTSCNS